MTYQEINSKKYARLAQIIESREPGVAVEAMKEFYKGIPLQELGIRADEDPTILAALTKSRASAERGYGIGELGEAIRIYSEQYQKAIIQTNISDILKTIKESNYTNLKPEFEKYINEHSDITFTQLAEIAGNKENPDPDAERALIMLQKLEEYKFEGELYPQIKQAYERRRTEALADNIYPQTLEETIRN